MNNMILQENVSSLSRFHRFELIYKLDIDESVIKYVKTRLKNLSIQIGADSKSNIITLMNKGLLEGWCWQTTESAIVFFNDDDSIERGYLTFGTFKIYWHSWICFTYNNTIWVFDPCLQILVEKSIYYYIFEINEIAGSVTAKSVREDLINSINQPHPQSHLQSNPHIADFLLPYVSEQQKKETKIYGNNDVTAPMYRNSTGYIATIDNNIITTLLAHYYFNG